MRRSKHSYGRSPSPPIFRIAIALFVVVCGGILLLASWRKGGDTNDEQESALQRRMRSTAAQVSNIANESRAAINEVEAARNALEATDYGRSRRHMQRAEETLEDLAARLDAVGSMLRNLANPHAAEAGAEAERGR